MADRPTEISSGPSTSPSVPVAGDSSTRRVGGASWVDLVVLLDHVAAALTFAAAGGYLVLRALNDRESALMRVVDEVARWFYYLDIHESPGLPDYRSLRNFADPYFADVYMIAMAALHLLAMAGFLALARGLARFRPWARRAHIGLAALILLILGVYAHFYAKSPAPRIGLAGMAIDAIVPMAVIAILMTPGIVSLFTEGPRLGSQPPSRPHARNSYQPRLVLGLFLTLFVIGALVTVFIVSAPIAINLKAALVPPE
jgi:hypothetical protein